jgi:hypothetical protein
MRSDTRWSGLLSALLVIGFLFPGCLFDSDDSSNLAVWMSIAPIQCRGNAWEQQDKTLEAYLADLGVEVLDKETSQWAEGVCEACSCPTGQRIDVLVREDDQETLLTAGFVREENWPY